MKPDEIREMSVEDIKARIDELTREHVTIDGAEREVARARRRIRELHGIHRAQRVEIRRTGRRWLYLGLYVEDCRHLSYKARYRPHERLVDGDWRRFASP